MFNKTTMRPDHVFVSLKVISCLQEGQKLSTRNGLLSIDRKANGLMRWLNGDNRMTTLMFISSVVNEALLSGCHQELLEAVAGIESLKVTYAEDSAFVAGVDVILKRILRPEPPSEQTRLRALSL
jgi:hypothetical protein